MEPRSESDILKKSLVLKFGEREYEVPVLRMLAAAKWRKEYFERTKEVSSAMIVENMDDKAQLSKAIGNALTGALLAFPEKIPELVFSYAPKLVNGDDLPKEKIMEEAYDQEFSRAFAQIWQVAFSPFLASLGMMLELQRTQQGSRSDSSAVLN